MALQLRDIFKGIWGRDNPRQYWKEIIGEIKKSYPDFIFIAESYWQKEGVLQQLGFDYTYDKYPLDILKRAVLNSDQRCYAQYISNIRELKSYIKRVPASYLNRSLHFLENHDEERGINIFGEERIFGIFALLKYLPCLLYTSPSPRD